MIEAIIFDFDGVIGDTMKDNCVAWQKAFATCNFDLDSTEYYMLEGMGRFQIAEYVISKYNLDPTVISEVVKKKEINYTSNNTFKIYNYVLDIFILLKKHNIKSAIVTGASHDRLWKYLDHDIARQLSAVITADDVTYTKPNPEPYLKAIDKLNLRPENCIIVENAILGIQSAKATGCLCFALETTLTKKHLSLADEIFSNHKELLDKFKNMFE
jgi:beta-phosphoglucomutase